MEKNEASWTYPRALIGLAGLSAALGLFGPLASGEAGRQPERPASTVPGRWVRVRASGFTMGSPPGEAGRNDGEDAHQVTLTVDVLIQATEVTQGQFLEVLGYNPSEFSSCGPGCPVEAVSWHQAADYCNALSRREGLEACYGCSGDRRSPTCRLRPQYKRPQDCPGYRLPTEAEWEHAARAGTSTATYNGDLDPDHLRCGEPNKALVEIAWFHGTASDRTHEVGQKRPNAWGLYDMLGNVAEWCHDWVDDYPTGAVVDPVAATPGEFRVIRGGSWNWDARNVRAADRFGGIPENRSGFVGLRPMRSLPPESPSGAALTR